MRSARQFFSPSKGFEDEESIPIEGLSEEGPQPVPRSESKIRHNQPTGGQPEADKPESKIRAFDQRMGNGRHEDSWERSPNVTGTGAIHVRSFHCKMNDESLRYLDEQVNEWLDAHPQYEVKFVTTSVGDWTGKTKEPNLIVQVWV